MSSPVAEQWLRPQPGLLNDRVAAFTTTRAGGCSLPPYDQFNLALHVGDDPQLVLDNRHLLSEVTGIGRIQWLEQVHGNAVLKAERATPSSVPMADASWTDNRGLGLAILTADCLPVVLAAVDGSAVGVAHAGWRGLLSGVLEQLLVAMPGSASEYAAWIGPAISQSAYEVGEEVAAQVRQRSRGSILIPGRKAGKYLLDLPGLASAMMKDLGVSEISSCGVCAAGDARTYSYRRDGVTGRMATVAWLR